MKKKAERIEKTKGKEEYWEVPSRHDMTTALMSSQLLWLPTLDLHKIKPAKILAVMG